MTLVAIADNPLLKQTLSVVVLVGAWVSITEGVLVATDWKLTLLIPALLVLATWDDEPYYPN